MVDAFGGSRVKVRPPERGVFALDHEGECKKEMRLFLDCLKEHDRDHFPCRQLSRSYLQCRMDKELMAKEDMNNLGLGDKERSYVRVNPNEGEKERQGFVAGKGVRSSNKGWWYG